LDGVVEISIHLGIESSTIAPLSNESWVAVRYMIRKDEINAIVGKLAQLGAKGIIK